MVSNHTASQNFPFNIAAQSLSVGKAHRRYNTSDLNILLALYVLYLGECRFKTDVISATRSSKRRLLADCYWDEYLNSSFILCAKVS